MELLDRVTLPPMGSYVIAVSGGVDSMVLLDLLASTKTYELTAVYIDHGWRDTGAEWENIQNACKQYNIPMRRIELNLKTKDEATARHARYEALEQVKGEVGAAAIITAHHQDDLIETVILNVMRGTGRRGLTPFTNRRDAVRPLLNIPKRDIMTYAREQKLKWVEDPTNTDTAYRRNQIRHELLPKLRTKDPQLDHRLLSYIKDAQALNARVNSALMTMVHTNDGLDAQRVSIQAALVRRLSIDVLQELLMYMVYAADPHFEPDSRAIEQLAINLKCGRLRGMQRLGKQLFVDVSRDTVAIAFKAQ